MKNSQKCNIIIKLDNKFEIVYGPNYFEIFTLLSSCLSMWKDPRGYIAYEFVFTSPAVSRISGSSNSDSFRNGWLGAVQLLFCGVLPPGLVQHNLQHSCVIAVKLFFPSVLLASMWCIHIAVSTRLLLGKLRFILSVRSDFHMTDTLSFAVHAFASHVLMSVSVDETLLPR